jgi:hypothetical protein
LARIVTHAFFAAFDRCSGVFVEAALRALAVLISAVRMTGILTGTGVVTMAGAMMTAGAGVTALVGLLVVGVALPVVFEVVGFAAVFFAVFVVLDVILCSLFRGFGCRFPMN